ncbi:hypothetical protein KA183_14790 [bacterium]|nr:hypothetical protein [bacterium]QQR58005.1 MAG: hypothetical protein IPG59_00520 [Candidatus Melainabacteria bacterium]
MVEVSPENKNDNCSDSEQDSCKKKSSEMARNLLRRLVTWISFGPGVLGFLWLIGKIVRR